MQTDDQNKDNASNFASLSITIQKFLNNIFTQLSALSDCNSTFVSNVLMLLKGVTPSTDLDNFKCIMLSFESRTEDKAIEQFVMYLRIICCRDCMTDEKIPILDEDDKFQYLKIAEIDQDLSFFATFLIENLIKYFEETRRNSLNYSVKEYKDKLNKDFDTIVLKTIFEMKGT